LAPIVLNHSPHLAAFMTVFDRILRPWFSNKGDLKTLRNGHGTFMLSMINDPKHLQNHVHATFLFTLQKLRKIDFKFKCF
jgi:hypothetical protein